jgi:hypothetical protein
LTRHPYGFNYGDFLHTAKFMVMGGIPGSLMGMVEAAEFYEYPDRNMIIKIKVNININNPMLAGIGVENPIDGRIDYRYENLMCIIVTLVTYNSLFIFSSTTYILC